MVFGEKMRGKDKLIFQMELPRLSLLKQPENIDIPAGKVPKYHHFLLSEQIANRQVGLLNQIKLKLALSYRLFEIDSIFQLLLRLFI